MKSRLAAVHEYARAIEPAVYPVFDVYEFIETTSRDIRLFFGLEGSDSDLE
jgi:hypothetical protein